MKEDSKTERLAQGKNLAFKFYMDAVVDSELVDCKNNGFAPKKMVVQIKDVFYESR